MPEFLHVTPDWPLPRRARVVLDTDTFNEADDQFALTYALLAPDRINLRAVVAAPFFNPRSTSPGDGMERSYHEIIRIFSLLGLSSEDRVFRGADSFLHSTTEPCRSEGIERIIELAREAKRDGELLYLVGIAAPTDLASVLLLAPELAGSIVVMWLGGHSRAAGRSGNQEFNLVSDLAASRVLYSCVAPFFRVPCRGVAELLTVSVAGMEKNPLYQSTAIGRHLFEYTRYFMQHEGVEKPDIKIIWDMAPIACFACPRAVLTSLRPSGSLDDDCTFREDGTRWMREVDYLDASAIFVDFYNRWDRAGLPG